MVTKADVVPVARRTPFGRLDAMRRLLHRSENARARWTPRSPFWIYLAGAVILIAPLLGTHLYAIPDAELMKQVRLARSAYVTLFHEWSWPPFYSNDIGMALQPLFRYYSFPVYAVSAGFMLLGLSAYNGLLLAAAVFYALGAFGLYRIARFLRCGRAASGIAGLTYLFAPYLTVDLYARAAFPEISAIGVIPLLFYAQLRLVASNGRRYRVSTALLTSLLLVSHKIFFAWEVILFCVLFLLVSGWQNVTRTLVRRPVSLAVWTAVGMALAAPYWLSSYLALPDLNISQSLGPSYVSLTNWRLTLWPWFRVSPDSTTPALATEIGLPCVMAGLLLIPLRGRRRLRFALGLIPLALVVLMSSPRGLLGILPRWLLAIQFPYRLLVFSALFGSLACGLVLARLRALRLPFVLLILATLAVYYRVPRASAIESGQVEHWVYDHEDYFEKDFAKTWIMAANLYWDSWLGQDAEIPIQRFPNDGAVVRLTGMIPHEIAGGRCLTAALFLQDLPWVTRDFCGAEVNLAEALPGSGADEVQRVRVHFSRSFVRKALDPASRDDRELVLYQAKFVAVRKDSLDLAELHARGNRVQFHLDAQRNRRYYVPVLYSRHLKVEPDFVKIEPALDGLALTSDRDGALQVRIARVEPLFLPEVMWCVLIALGGYAARERVRTRRG